MSVIVCFLETTKSLQTEFVALAYLQKDSLRKEYHETKESLERPEWELEGL